MKKSIVSLLGLMGVLAGVIYVGDGDPTRKVVVAWDPNPVSEDVSGYLVDIATNETEMTNTLRIYVPATNQPCARIEGLPADKWYVIAVTATNAWGESPHSRKVVYFRAENATNVGVTWRFEKGPRVRIHHTEYGWVDTIGNLILETPAEPGYTYWVAENRNGEPFGDCPCLPEGYQSPSMHFNKTFLDLFIGAPQSNSLLQVKLPVMVGSSIGKGLNYKIWRTSSGPGITNVNTFARFL